jgi:hypothetical protein
MVLVLSLYVVGLHAWDDPGGRRGLLSEPCRLELCEGHLTPEGD